MKKTRHHRAVALAFVAVTATAFAACDSDDDDSSATASEVADDGPTTLAKGQDIELVGDSGFANQTLNIDAEEDDGEVTGEFRITDNVFPLECADTDTDGVVILGGEATAGSDFTGQLHALIIREGDPDSVHLYANDIDAGSCTELLESIPDDLLTDGEFEDVEDGYDIETG